MLRWWALATSGVGTGSVRMQLPQADEDPLPLSAMSAAGTHRVVTAWASEAARPGFKSWHCQLLPVCLWEDDLVSLSLSETGM